MYIIVFQPSLPRSLRSTTRFFSLLPYCCFPCPLYSFDCCNSMLSLFLRRMLLPFIVLCLRYGSSDDGIDDGSDDDDDNDNNNDIEGSDDDDNADSSRFNLVRSE